MEIIHKTHSNRSFSLSSIRSEKRHSDILQNTEKELLNQMSEALTVVHGGHYKRRRQIA